MAKQNHKLMKRKAEEEQVEVDAEEWTSEEADQSQEELNSSKDENSGAETDDDSDEEPEEISTAKAKETALHLQKEEKLKKLESQKELKQKRRERDLKNSLQQQQKRARLLPQEIIEAAQEEEENVPEEPKINNTHLRLEKKLESAQHGNITVTIAKNRISNPIDPELLEFRNKHLYRSSVKRAPGKFKLIAVLKNFKILDTKTVPTSVSFQLSKKK
ncbi:hypothetical protein HK103_006743 [Boothiomyces macroporosus]|uniref:Uncharacterized protein n=1 Tax=Boothiomyces macroporosus TaxID=261099 RepID=A0AAD5Y6V0_9FUNG|nr:hypothetical protein HK103_006743 [Boothiomyces macroporosus]